MKKGFIIGKRHFILAGLVFALAIAVWLNMSYAAKDGGFDIAAELTSSKYLGEAQYVAASGEQSTGEVVATAAGTDNISSAKAVRDETRNEAIELLEDTVKDGKSVGADVESAIGKISELTQNIDDEASIETLLSAKGYYGIAIIGDSSVTVTVSADELLPNQTLQIQDAVTSVVDTKLENIKIITVK